MSAGVKFSIRAAQVRMGVWLQVNCKNRVCIRVTKERKGYQGHTQVPHTPGAKVLRDGKSGSGNKEGSLESISPLLGHQVF
jgi:hypothetical protein